MTITLTPTFYTPTARCQRNTCRAVTVSHSTWVPSQGGDWLSSITSGNPQLDWSLILISPSLEKLGWEEKLLPLETTVLAESLTSEFMEAGQHCINASAASCPWHRDLLNVD